MKHLAIQGNNKQSEQIKELFKQLGGINNKHFVFNLPTLAYFIDSSGSISYIHTSEIDKNKYVFFTFDEFKLQFPYKIGDNVYSSILNKEVNIINMWWDEEDETIYYRISTTRTINIKCTATNLSYINSFQNKHQTTMNIAEILKNAPVGTKLYSPVCGEVTLHRIKDSRHPIEVSDENGEFESFTADGRYYDDFSNGECVLFPSKENRDWSTFKVEPQFPMTCGECSRELNLSFKECKYRFLLGATDGFGKMVDYKDDGLHFSELNALYKLLICRDAWWKVDNDWKPDWSENNYKYVINTCKNTIDRCVAIDNSHILAFRTPTIRDKFLDTFRDLIKECKELI